MPASGFGAADGGEGALDLAVGFFALEGLAFVELAFAFAEGEEDFGVALGEINPQRQQGHAFDLEFAGEAVNFFFVEEEPARAERVNVPAVALFVGGDVGVVEPALGAIYLAEGVVNGGAGGAEALDLGAFQLDAGFECFADDVVAASFVVVNGRRHVGGSITGAGANPKFSLALS